MNIQYLSILAIILLFIACRKEDTQVLTTCTPDTSICLADEPLTVYYDNLVRFTSPNNHYQIFITDLEGQLVSCRQLTNAVNQYALDRPCGKFHLHVVNQICAGDSRPCQQIDITTYTDLDTESWYFKAFRTSASVFTDTVDIRINLDQCYTGFTAIGPNSHGQVTLFEDGCSDIRYYTPLLLTEGMDKFFIAYRSTDTAPDWNYQLFENLYGQEEIWLSEQDFPASPPANLQVEHPAEASGVIIDIKARAIINNGYHYWDIFPYRMSALGVLENPDVVPNPVGLFPHFMTHFRQNINGISYLRSQLAEDIDVAYFPEPFDLQLEMNGWNKFKIKKTAGAASSERFILNLSARHCSQILSWSIYGATEQDIHFAQCLPTCVEQSIPQELMDQLSPSSLRSIHDTQHPTYAEWIEAFIDADLPRSDWYFSESHNRFHTVEPGTELPKMTLEIRDKLLK